MREPEANGRDGDALARLADAVRAARRSAGLSRADVALRAGLSLRFLAQLEAGTGNISYLNLRRLAGALGVDTALLVSRAQVRGRRSIVLLGMRGAGKSTVGRRLSDRLGLEFVELDEAVETDAAMPLGQIFELQGESFYRRLERDAVTRLLARADPAVAAAGGGLVTEPHTFGLVLRDTFSVWLKAPARLHWDRVIAQGDRRPMQDRPEAMMELERLWAARAPGYARAHLTVDTSLASVEEVVSEIARAAEESATGQRS
jgi:XRE family aerobic/anaerobic benzoate catabolism transcriptional regulator